MMLRFQLSTLYQASPFSFGTESTTRCLVDAVFLIAICGLLGAILDLTWVSCVN